MPKIAVAVIGAGAIGRAHIETIRRSQVCALAGIAVVLHTSAERVPTDLGVGIALLTHQAFDLGNPNEDYVCK